MCVCGYIKLCSISMVNFWLDMKTSHHIVYFADSTYTCDVYVFHQDLIILYLLTGNILYPENEVFLELSNL